MRADSREFPHKARTALANPVLQKALGNIKRGFITKRARARDALPEFDDLRDQARNIKNHTLAHLDLYLERFESSVIRSGGKVHWAATADDARVAVLEICRGAGARTVTKGKSMITEEIELNRVLETSGLEVIETDLGEYIVQLRGETPSHIVAPAVHLNKEDVEHEFRTAHGELPEDRPLGRPEQLVGEARRVIREKFLAADVGITGANFLIAETGTTVIVTNEGNGDLTQSLPRVHIVVASIEKIVPTLEDAMTLMRVLARSATGQEISTYTTFSTGPRRAEDPDGPEEFHVVILDNGRSSMLGSPFQDMLRCIRCGACLNHCPVYQAVGGHAYGSVYPGPMGAVLTPSLAGIETASHLPNASTLCGRCEAVCPMRIPLPAMIREWRQRDFAGKPATSFQKMALSAWAFFARHPSLYRKGASLAAAFLALAAGRRGRLSRLPLARAWTKGRDLPAPEGRTFMAQWRDRSGS